MMRAWGIKVVELVSKGPNWSTLGLVENPEDKALDKSIERWTYFSFFG
jgi:hypothetical protein